MKLSNHLGFGKKLLRNKLKIFFKKIKNLKKTTIKTYFKKIIT